MYLLLHQTLDGGTWYQHGYMPTPGGGVSSTRTSGSEMEEEMLPLPDAERLGRQKQQQPTLRRSIVSYILGIKV